MPKKKKKNEVLQEMKPTLQLAGLSMGSSILGGALHSKLPTGITNPLTKTGEVTGKFIAPMATLGVMSYTMKKMKKLEKKVKGVNKFKV